MAYISWPRAAAEKVCITTPPPPLRRRGRCRASTLCTPRSTCHTHPMTDDERAALLALREQGERDGLAWVVESCDLALWEG